MWFLVTTLLGVLSGWYKLMMEYPDSDDTGELFSTYSGRSGSMGLSVNMSRILTLETRRHGLRIKMMRIFGIFNRPIFVPWKDIKIERKKAIWGDRATLYFGNGGNFERLSLEADLANLLWRDASEVWPERGEIPRMLDGRALARAYFIQWLGITVLASAFFIVVPRLVQEGSHGQIKDGNFPPIAVSILLPAIVFGLASIFRYFFKTREWKRKIIEDTQSRKIH